MNSKVYCVYIMTNECNTTFYIGFSHDLKKRVHTHKEKIVAGFTKRYNLTKLVYFECGEGKEGVLAREKQLKRWSRAKKIALIKRTNPNFEDLYARL